MDIPLKIVRTFWVNPGLCTISSHGESRMEYMLNHNWHGLLDGRFCSCHNVTPANPKGPGWASHPSGPQQPGSRAHPGGSMRPGGQQAACPLHCVSCGRSSCSCLLQRQVVLGDVSDCQVASRRSRKRVPFLSVPIWLKMKFLKSEYETR